MITRVRGTEDFLDLTLHNFVLEQAKKHFASYNFSQIETPILEHTALFKRSLGATTDVVSKEMYTLTTESGDELCLRPEATAPTMRAFLEAKIDQTPWKVFSYGPMFRHERPQKGRWRQFSQINIEAIGTAAISQDAQTIAMLDRFFGETLQLEDYILKLNFLGTRDDRENYNKALHTFLENISDQLCKTCLVRKESNILRVLDCKNETCIKLYQNAPKITDNLSSESQAQWAQLQELLAQLSVSFVLDPKLVRGLDYYNKTVFEFASPLLGAQDAFCGGGRYDTLATEIGAKEDYRSIGSAIGMGRLLLLCEHISDKLMLPEKPALHMIVPMSEAQQPLALLLAYELLGKGLCTDVVLEGGSIKSMMRRANKQGAKWVLVLGEQELQDGTVALKNMVTGEQEVVKQTDVLKHLR